MDFLKLTKKFLFSENKDGPGLFSYIQALQEDLNNIAPRSFTERRRLEIAKENLLNIRRKSRQLEQKLIMLEEQIKVLEEQKIKK